MSTEKQTAANRRNAEKSTGPKTEAGKKRSSQNAFKHGSRSNQMIVPGEDPEQLKALIEGYRDFHDFAPAELALIEPLRALRQIHYTAWLARRWVDPAFPTAFPWFDTHGYWDDHVESLRRQLDELDAPIPEL